MAVVELKNVSKSFNGRKALWRINLKIDAGDFLVIAGENGSGKSTLLRIICGLLIPEEGEVRVFGMDAVREWKRLAGRIGVVLANERSLYWKLTGLENLEVFAGIYGVKNGRERALELLERLNLLEAKDRLVEEYSTGMRRKLLLAKALVHDPNLLLLDEVLNGLDPKSYIEIVNFLDELNREGKTVILVSHILHDLPERARLLVMKDGRIILEERLSNVEIGGVRVRAVIDGEEIEELVSEKELGEFLRGLAESGAEDIRVERDDLYSLLRRVL